MALLASPIKSPPLRIDHRRERTLLPYLPVPTSWATIVPSIVGGGYLRQTRQARPCAGPCRPFHSRKSRAFARAFQIWFFMTSSCEARGKSRALVADLNEQPASCLSIEVSMFREAGTTVAQGSSFLPKPVLNDSRRGRCEGPRSPHSSFHCCADSSRTLLNIDVHMYRAFLLGFRTTGTILLVGLSLLLDKQPTVRSSAASFP
jgi:hypothetical protein